MQMRLLGGGKSMNDDSMQDDMIIVHLICLLRIVGFLTCCIWDFSYLVWAHIVRREFEGFSHNILPYPQLGGDFSCYS